MSSVVVDLDVLRRLARNQELKNRLPCLENLTNSEVKRTGGRNCRKCSKKKTITQVDAVNEAALKRCLYGASGEVRDIAKSILGKKHLIFYFAEEDMPPRVTV